MANDTKIKIGGRTITLSGSESAEYMQKVAEYLNGKRNSFNEDSSFWTLPEDMKNIMIQLNLADDYFKARERGEKLDKAMEAMKEAHAKELEEVREESRQELERALHQSQDDNILEIESLKKQLSEARTQLTGTQTIMKQLQASLQKEKTRATESEETLEKERAAIKDKEQRFPAR
ncbi:MAG: cell division protein ZapA [Lachnospiraceae bacterium]|nr:cell division protein ZapA [Lachnospiraceae bacterium]